LNKWICPGCFFLWGYVQAVIGVLYLDIFTTWRHCAMMRDWCLCLLRWWSQPQTKH